MLVSVSSIEGDRGSKVVVKKAMGSDFLGIRDELLFELEFELSESVGISILSENIFIILSSASDMRSGSLSQYESCSYNSVSWSSDSETWDSWPSSISERSTFTSSSSTADSNRSNSVGKKNGINFMSCVTCRIKLH